MVRTMSFLFASLTIGALFFVACTIALGLAGRVSARARQRAGALHEYLRPALLPFAWVVATIATMGSLYYSEFAGFVPCKLCWYQRIAMYPLAVILGIAAYHDDVRIRRYVLPLVSIGAALSIYHYQLQRFPSQGSFSCTVDAPCSMTWVWQFHFVSIPLMAFAAFTLIATLLLLTPGPSATVAVDHASPIKEHVLT